MSKPTDARYRRDNGSQPEVLMPLPARTSAAWLDHELMQRTVAQTPRRDNLTLLQGSDLRDSE